MTNKENCIVAISCVVLAILGFKSGEKYAQREINRSKSNDDINLVKSLKRFFLSEEIYGVSSEEWINKKRDNFYGTWF